MSQREPRTRRLKTNDGSTLRGHRESVRRFDFFRGRLDSVDVEALWENLETQLSVGRNRRDSEVLARALDSAESNLRNAGLLYRVAVEELEVFEIDWKAEFGCWEAKARQAIEEAKKAKRLSGVTTIDMVERWIARNVSEYKEWSDHRRTLARSVALTKDMYKAWENRSATLRKLADLNDQRPGTMPRRRGESDERD